MKYIFAIGLMGLLPIAAGAAPTETCAHWAHKIVAGDADACSDLCPQATKSDHYNYRHGLIAAFKTKNGLDHFLSYLDHSSIIGAGAEAHACSVRALLEHWGDNIFAHRLSRQTRYAKDQAIGLLDYTAIPQFKKRYPKTYMLADHE